ncbi:MAG: hypothetical protein OXH39_00485 [Candidatus Poribacteria bacterium]|nr:hypothetical protein [Candidatus Poribacteria bacterium]
MSVLTQILMQGVVDRQSLRDIKPPVEVSQSLLPYFIGGVMILGFVAILVWSYIRRLRQVQPVPATEVDDAPLAHEVAYERLAAIEAADWLALGDMETYHTQVAYVLREYIRARYRIPALELTTTALLHAMLRAQIDAAYVERVQQLLANCDKVKFATYQPELAEASARVADARWIVDETKSSVL